MHDKKICAITGSQGYVGRCLKNHLLAHDWDVLELTRRGQSDLPAVTFQLGAEVSPAALAGVTALVHCAYDFKPLTWREIHQVNVEGSRRLFQAARAAGIQKLIFISSISAYDGCRSLYGKAKLAIEKIALEHGALILRPGLVHSDDPGGMFGKLADQIRRSSLVPMIGNGSQIQYLVHGRDLADFVQRGVEGKFPDPRQPITVAHAQPWTFREILEQIARQQNRKVFFLPLPWRLIWLGIKSAEMCRIPLSFRSDSLISLIYQNPHPSFAELKATGFECRPFH